jgi:hypothetical protein
MDAGQAPSASNWTPTSTSPRQPSTTPRPAPPATGATSTRVAGGHADRQQAQQAQRLEDFVEAHGDAGGDVAALVGGGRTPSVCRAAAGCSPGDGRGRRAACRWRAPPCRRATVRAPGRVDDAGGDEAVLQTGVLVVEPAQLPSPRPIAPHCSTMAARPAASMSQATPPGTMRSIRKRWPNSVALSRTQSSLRRRNWVRPKARRRRCPARRGRRDGWRRARVPASARAASRARGGAADAAGGFDGIGIGPGVGAGGIAGDAADQLRAAAMSAPMNSFSTPLCW